jgi:hypothetical protein
MLASLLGEVVTSIVGETIIGLLLPDVSKPKSSPPEGEWNASLGSLAVFLASIAALVCGLATSGVLRGMTDSLLSLLLGGAVMLAIFAGVLAHRALEVTGRRRALARIGLWLSRVTILTALFAVALLIAGVTVPFQ